MYSLHWQPLDYWQKQADFLKHTETIYYTSSWI